MLLLLKAIAVTGALPLQAALRQALQGIPIHGHQFRTAVEDVAARYPAMFGQPMHFFAYKHPLGRTDSTLVSLGVDKYENLSFVVLRRRSRALVESLNTREELQEGASVPGLTAWSGARFCVFLRFEGGTGNTDSARMFELSRGRWRIVKYLDAFGENAREGSLSHERIARSQPVDIRDCLVVRRPPPGLEDRLAHSGVWFDYRQEWRFTGGGLRQTRLDRLATPAAAVYDLFRLVAQHRRREFYRRVPIALRRRLWREFSSLDFVPYKSGDGYWSDECPELIIGGVLPLTLTRLHGKWTVTRIGERL